MHRTELLVEQVEDLVVVNLEVAALYDEDALLDLFARFDLLK